MKPQSIDPSAAVARILKLTQRHDLLVILAETGMRAGEAEWLTWSDVNLKDGTVAIRAKEGRQLKPGAEREIRLTPTARKAFARLPRLGRWVFTTSMAASGQSPAQQLSIRRVIAVLQPLLGQDRMPKNLHDFRKAWMQKVIIETSGVTKDGHDRRRDGGDVGGHDDHRGQ